MREFVGRKICFFTLMFVMAAFISVGFAGEESVIVWKGKGIVVTQKDVTELIDFFKPVFTSTDEEYLSAALKLKLYATEARLLGLGKDRDSGEDTVSQLNELQKLYSAMILDTYPVSDLAVESYYWSHPKVFQLKKGEQASFPELMPLDDNIKERIRQAIRNAKSSELLSKAFEELKKKYEIQFCNDKGECK